MHRFHILGSVLPAIVLLCGPSSSLAQVRRCCLPNGSCETTTAYDCNRSGGVWRLDEYNCNGTPCPAPFPGVSMSQTAARRLVREGTVHTLWVHNPEELYAADLEIWSLARPISEAGYGMLIAPQIGIDLRLYDGADLEARAEAAAAGLIAKLASAKVVWDASPYGLEGVPFRWALRIEALGIGFDWQVGPGKLPCFTNHREDVPSTKLPRQRYIDQGGRVIASSASPTPTVRIADIDSHTAFFEQFPDDYYTAPWHAVIVIGEGEDAQVRTITAYDHATSTLTLDSAYTGSDANPPFHITRADPGADGGLYPCYFFKHGAAEVEAWVVAFCGAMGAAMEGQDWLPGVGPPVAVIVGDEDHTSPAVDYSNYYDTYRTDGRASDSTYKIDATHTLAQWHDAYARHRNGDAFTSSDFVPNGSDYSPLNEEVRSYLNCTYQTAYNYHRERSTWRHFRGLWPRAHLSQYLLGRGYGVQHEGARYEVPVGPQEAVFHGTRKWAGSVSWEAYYPILNPNYTARPGPDGGVVPIYQPSARYIDVAVDSWDWGTPGELMVQPFSGFDPDDWLSLNYPLFVQFTGGGSANAGRIIPVASWNASTLTFALDESLIGPVSTNEPFVLYYPSGPGADSLRATNPVKWPLIQTFCERYGLNVDAGGFLNAAKNWAAETARAQTRALPASFVLRLLRPGEFPRPRALRRPGRARLLSRDLSESPDVLPGRLAQRVRLVRRRAAGHELRGQRLCLVCAGIVGVAGDHARDIRGARRDRRRLSRALPLHLRADRLHCRLGHGRHGRGGGPCEVRDALGHPEPRDRL